MMQPFFWPEKVTILTWIYPGKDVWVIQEVGTQILQSTKSWANLDEYWDGCAFVG